MFCGQSSSMPSTPVKLEALLNCRLAWGRTTIIAQTVQKTRERVRPQGLVSGGSFPPPPTAGIPIVFGVVTCLAVRSAEFKWVSVLNRASAA